MKEFPHDPMDCAKEYLRLMDASGNARLIELAEVIRKYLVDKVGFPPVMFDRFLEKLTELMQTEPPEVQEAFNLVSKKALESVFGGDGVEKEARRRIKRGALGGVN